MTQQLRVDGVTVGHCTDRDGATGCTVVLAPEGATGSVDVRGGAASTRETDLLSPYSTVAEVHGVALCGGSSPGLAAADGVVRFLEEHGRGYVTLYGRIPLVPGAVIYDLGIGDAAGRPRAEHGYEAARAATDVVAEGSVGAGTGATVGKILGEDGWMKGGVGIATRTLPGEVTVTALAVVNAFGDVLAEDGSILAGAREGSAFLDSRDYVLSLDEHPHFDRAAATNTTLAVVMTDAAMSKTQCALVARMAQDGLARAINPVHTPVDGDTVFVLATGRRPSNIFQLGTAAAEVVAAAIRRGVREAEGLAGVPALRDWNTRGPRDGR